MSRTTTRIPRIRPRKSRKPSPGSPPGTLAPVEGQPAPEITRYVYNADACETSRIAATEIEAILAVPEGKTVWIDVQGLGDVDVLQRMATTLRLHPLSLEDIVHLHQRPKYEEFEDYLFIVLRSVRLLEDDRIENEQISFIVKPGMLVSFQECPGDGFAPVRRRLEEGKGTIRRASADYLAYSLIDAVIDDYYPVLEAYSTTMDELDDAVRSGPDEHLSRAIHGLRYELRNIRRAVWPLRDVTGALSRDDVALIDQNVRRSFRDCHDHVIQAVESIEVVRERASELADLFLIIMGERTNQVMKVLTIIATVFIPLTFLCGVYGMNFDPDASPYNMPELRWRYGYPLFWAVTIAVFVGMLLFFRVRGWLGSSSTTDQDEGARRR